MKTTKVMIQMMTMAKMLLRMMMMVAKMLMMMMTMAKILIIMMMMMAKEYKTQPLVSDWIDGSARRETDLFQLSQSLYTLYHCIIYSFHLLVVFYFYDSKVRLLK